MSQEIDVAKADDETVAEGMAFEPGDVVRFRNAAGRWRRGRVIRIKDSTREYVIRQEDPPLRRTRPEDEVLSV